MIIDEKSVYQVGKYSVHQIRDDNGDLIGRVVLMNGNDASDTIDLPTDWTIARCVHHLEKYVEDMEVVE